MCVYVCECLVGACMLMIVCAYMVVCMFIYIYMCVCVCVCECVCMCMLPSMLQNVLMLCILCRARFVSTLRIIAP